MWTRSARTPRAATPTPQHSCDLRPGDLIVSFRNPFVAGDYSHLEWSRLVAVNAWITPDGDLDAVLTTTSAFGLDMSNLVDVYRHDTNGRIVDVTFGKFCQVENMSVYRGHMLKGTYYDDGERMRDIQSKHQRATNRKLMFISSLKNVQVPVTNPSSTILEPNLKKVMDLIISQHQFNAASRQSQPTSPITTPRATGSILCSTSLSSITMPDNIPDPLWFYGQMKDIFSNKLDLSNDVTTTQSIEQLLPKHGVIIRKLCTGLQPLLWATIFDHPDHDVLHALKKYGQPPSTPHSPTSLSLDTLALRQIIIDPESLVRVTWFTLDIETKSAIRRFVSDTRQRASPVHSNYPHLAQYSPPTIPPDLLPLQELAATAIRSVGYNTTESGVYFDSVHSLYSRGHVMQDPHLTLIQHQCPRQPLPPMIN